MNVFAPFVPQKGHSWILEYEGKFMRELNWIYPPSNWGINNLYILNLLQI